MRLTCIMCPLGCQIDIEKDQGRYIVKGNSCGRGKDYAISEMTCPKRIVTALVHTPHGVLPVKTTIAVPKDKINDVLNAISKLKLTDAKYGEMIINNVCDTGANIIVTGSHIV